jgi:hypothetical protein
MSRYPLELAVEEYWFGFKFLPQLLFPLLFGFVRFALVLSILGNILENMGRTPGYSGQHAILLSLGL